MSGFEQIRLSELIDALRVELAVAIDQGKNQAIQFGVGPIELEVEIGVSKTTTGGGGVEFWVVKAAGERGHEDVVTHRVKVTLEPKLASGSGPLEVAAPSSSGQPPVFPPRPKR
jgi:hypothetical protein